MAKWKKTPINEFLRERPGRYNPNDTKVISLKRLDKIDFNGGMHFSNKSSKTDMIIVKKGDLVISGINVSKGALAIYEGKEDITATIHYSSYIFDEKKINIEYFKRFLKSPKFIQLLKDQVKGGIKTEIKPKHLLPLKINLPNLITQKSIVEFFKKTENEIDEISNQISYQENIIKQLRQAILQEAVKGELTAKWRKKHQELISGENHAAKLLEKIKVEKEKLVKEGKIKKQKPLSSISKEEKPFDLPDGWVWCRLKEVTSLITDGEHQTPPKSSGIYKMLSAKNIRDGYIDFNNVDYIDKFYFEKLKKRCAPLKNDILIVSVGATIGRSSVLIKNNQFVIVRSVALVRPLFVNPFYLKIILDSPILQKDIAKRAWGSAQPCLYLNQINKIICPVPSLGEQIEIVKKVARLIKKIDLLEEQVKERKEYSEQLMQSILREAFEGR